MCGMRKPDLDKFYNLIDRRIAKFGWTSVYVPADGDMPPYAYTVGLSEVGKQDFLMVGQEHCTVCFMFYRLWELSDQDLVKGPGTLKKVMQDIDIDLVKVAQTQAEMFAKVARRRLGSGKLNMLQVVMPDRDQKLSAGMSLEEEEELAFYIHHRM
jgi:hypothetical protein